MCFGIGVQALRAALLGMQLSDMQHSYCSKVLPFANRTIVSLACCGIPPSPTPYIAHWTPMVGARWMV